MEPNHPGTARPARQCLLVMLVAMAWSSPPVHAQGFLLRPMTLEVSAAPGQTVEAALEVRNTKPTGILAVEFIPTVLTQGPNATWLLVEPLAAAEAIRDGSARSCMDWLTLSAPTVELAPLEHESIKVGFKVPRTARGTYSAGLLVRRPAAEGTGVGLAIQFLVPIVLTIQGPSGREKVETESLGLAWVQGAAGQGGTTVARLTVRNAGETHTRVSGGVTVFGQAGPNWVRVGSAPLPDRLLLPGGAVPFYLDLKRSLPSGRYKVVGNLRLSGRPRGGLTQEVDLVGDPLITRLATDVTLQLEPSTIEVVALPGASRLTSLTIRNPSDQPVQVSCSVQIPLELQGVALGALDGKDFSSASWVELEPAAFELRAGSSRKLRLNVVVPEAAEPQANSYATVRVVSLYPDGQAAGELDALLVVTNPMVQPEAKGIVRRPSLIAQQDNQYGVTAKFENHGNIAFSPTLQAQLLDPLAAVVAQTSLETDGRLVLPLGTIHGSGVLDFSAVAPGDYFVVVTMGYLGAEAVSRVPIRVELAGGERVVTVPESTTPPDEPVAPGDDEAVDE